MKNLVTTLSILLSSIMFSQTYSGPESVEYDYTNQRWLVANTTSHQVIARNSAGTLSVFATGLVSGPHGIEIVDDVLYCCSGGSIKGYSLTNGANVFTLNLGASFLNGLTHDNSGNLYATDFSAKKIFKVIIASQTFSEIANNLVQSPNGIVFDEANNRCVFVNWGSNAPIKAIDLGTNTVTTVLATNNGNCDGISRDNAGNYYVSTWSTQRVLQYNSTFSNTPVPVATGLSNPADIFVNVVDNVLGIPNSGNNTVAFVNLVLANNTFNQSEFSKTVVYPNPASKTATLKLDLQKPSVILGKIVTIDGKLVETIDFGTDYIQKQNLEIDISNYKTGMYYLILNTVNNSKSFPILVK